MSSTFVSAEMKALAKTQEDFLGLTGQLTEKVNSLSADDSLMKSYETIKQLDGLLSQWGNLKKVIMAQALTASLPNNSNNPQQQKDLAVLLKSLADQLDHAIQPLLNQNMQYKNGDLKINKEEKTMMVRKIAEVERELQNTAETRGPRRR